MSSLIPAYPRADQPFQTQRTNHPHHFSTNLANHRKQKNSSRRRRVSSPANHPASHHASRRGLAHRPPREQERARPPATQTGHQVSKQPRRLSSPTGHPDGHHAVRRELAGRPPRRPLGAIGYMCDSGGHEVIAVGGTSYGLWGSLLFSWICFVRIQILPTPVPAWFARWRDIHSGTIFSRTGSADFSSNSGDLI
jgi:hypothetical protein